MECKATLLDVFIYVRKVKENNRKWRKYWVKSTETKIFEISSDEEMPPDQIKQEPDIEIGDDDVDRPVFKSSQYIKEEGETSDSDFEEKELVIECDVLTDGGSIVTSTTREEQANSNTLNLAIKQESTESPKKKTIKGPTLRKNRLTTAILDWPTSEESTDSDSDVEVIPIKKPLIDLTKKPPKPDIKPTQPSVPTTTTSTLAWTQEIEKMGLSTLAEKMLAIKRTPNLTDDQMCKIFYELKCHSCPNKDFTTLDDLEKHFILEHGIPKISVKCCNMDIIKPIMVDHIKYHLGLKKSSLKDHVRRLQTMHICEECGLLFPSEKYLKLHISRSHTDLHTTLRTRSLSLNVAAAPTINITSGELKLSRYSCDVCEKPFYYQSSMKHHKVKHLSFEEQLKYKRFKCHDCDMLFFYKQDIQKHIEVVHAKYRRMATGRVTCLECNSVLSSISFLMIHKAIHWTPEERRRNLKNKCHICDKLFWMKSSMRKHEKIHTNSPTAPKTKKCPHCEKCFASNQNLMKHLRTHMSTQELYENKTHECSTCLKRFWTETSLSDHIKFMHLKVYDYVCEKCKRPYSSEKNLKYHPCGKTMQVHRKKPEEKEECEFCGKVFNSQKQLKCHMYQWHLPGYIYECPICKRGFNHGSAFCHHKQKCAKKTSAKND